MSAKVTPERVRLLPVQDELDLRRGRQALDVDALQDRALARRPSATGRARPPEPRSPAGPCPAAEGESAGVAEGVDGGGDSDMAMASGIPPSAALARGGDGVGAVVRAALAPGLQPTKLSAAFWPWPEKPKPSSRVLAVDAGSRAKCSSMRLTSRACAQWPTPAGSERRR